MRNLLYLFCWSVPISGFIALHYGGYLSGLTCLVVGLVFPFLEWLMGRDASKPLIAPVRPYSSRWFFYQSIPYGYAILHLVLLFFYCRTIGSVPFGWSWIWRTLSVAFASLIGFNIAHEWLHKKTTRYLGLLYSNVMSAFLFSYREHIPIHHNPLYSVSSEDFFSTPRYGVRFIQNFFHILGFIYNPNYFTKNTRTIQLFPKWLTYYTVISFLIFIYSIFFFFQLKVMIGYAIQSLFGFMLAHSIFYMQHYGLLRSTLPSGALEPFSNRFTWDCNFVFSNFLFLNLPRHSHHHLHQSLPYWELKNDPESPQMPYGYFTMLWFVWIPPLFFRLMNPRVEAETKKTEELRLKKEQEADFT